MKNNVKLIITTLTVFLLTLSLTGCNLFGTSGEISTGGLLSVNSDGHFKEDIVYTGDKSRESFKSDGTYEYIRYNLVDGNKEIIDGTQGSYTWNDETMLLKISETKEYNTTTKVWDNLEALNNYMYSTFVAFFESQYGTAVVWNESTESWDMSYITFHENGEKDYESIYSIKIDLENKKISNTRLHSEYNTDGEMTYSAKTIIEGTIDSAFPNGADLKKGNQLSLNYIETTNTLQYYNFTTETWDDPIDEGLDLDNFSFVHMGDFLYMPSETSSRGL